MFRSNDGYSMGGSDFQSGKKCLQDLQFESVAARTVTEGKKKFVVSLKHRDIDTWNLQ